MENIRYAKNLTVDLSKYDLDRH